MLYKLCKLCLQEKKFPPKNFFQPREEIYYTSSKKTKFLDLFEKTDHLVPQKFLC